MIKYFLIPALLFTCQLPVISQKLNIDSLRIDSLKKQLFYLKDSARVNLLLAITEQSGYFPPKLMADSNLYYMNLAYKEAYNLGYKYGMAMSNIRIGNRELFRNKNVPEAKKYITAAVSLGESIHNPKILSRAYYSLAEVLMKENMEENFSKAEGYYKKSVVNYRMIGDKEGEGEVSWSICSMLSGKGDYEEGMNYCENALQLNKMTAHTDWGHQLVLFSLLSMANLYVTVGDYETAKSYIAQGIRYANENIGWQLDDAIAMLYIKMHQPDSAMNHLKMIPNRFQNTFYIKNYLGQVYLLKQEYNKSLQFFNQAIDSVKKEGKFHNYTKILLDIGKAYEGNKNNREALKYAKEGLALAEKYNIRPYRLEAYQLLSSIYHTTKNNTSAYQYLYKYTGLKDSLLNNQFYWRLNNYKRIAEDEKKTNQIDLLNKNNQLKEQQLKQESLIKKVLIAGLILFSLIGIFVFRTLTLKRKNEKLRREKVENEMKFQQLENQKNQADFQRKAADLEMQALRAQMNPHFIFNCLSSINRFILKNETKIASNYLTRFSRLMRMVLINSRKPLIALEDEYQMLSLYLEMERLRFKNSFDYGITFLNAIDSDNIFIPPLLLQPFCENAIWHGLMNLPVREAGLPTGQAGKEGQGRLDIELSMEDNILNCIITDNGVGREKAEGMKSKTAEKEKSMGLKITTERLALLNSEKGLHNFYEIEDLKDENGNAAGTKVTLKISFKESVEEAV